jgi:hypothetical protein
MTKLEKHELNWRGRNWQRFSMSHRGRMSWADWFRDYIENKHVLIMKSRVRYTYNDER